MLHTPLLSSEKRNTRSGTAAQEMLGLSDCHLPKHYMCVCVSISEKIYSSEIKTMEVWFIIVFKKDLTLLFCDIS